MSKEERRPFVSATQFYGYHQYSNKAKPYNPHEPVWEGHSCRSVVLQELNNYVGKVLGPDPSALELIDYARRLIVAAACANEWLKENSTIKTFFDNIDNSVTEHGTALLPLALIACWDHVA